MGGVGVERVRVGGGQGGLRMCVCVCEREGVRA